MGPLFKGMTLNGSLDPPGLPGDVPPSSSGFPSKEHVMAELKKPKKVVIPAPERKPIGTAQTTKDLLKSIRERQTSDGNNG